MMFLFVMLSVAAGGVLGQHSALAPSASRNPPPIHIPTPYDHHANSVFSAKGEKHHKSESHEKKTKKKKKSSEYDEVTDDLFYLFPNPVVIAGGGRHSDDDDDDETPQFPFPTKIDNLLPPTYQTPHPPSAGTASPTEELMWKADNYPPGYGEASSPSKSEKHSKGESKGGENSYPTPSSGSVYLPPVPDCYQYGVNRCDGDGEFPNHGRISFLNQSRLFRIDQATNGDRSPVDQPVRSPVYYSGESKREQDDEDPEKEEKLQKNTPGSKQEIAPITVSMPSPSVATPSVRPAFRSENPTSSPVTSTIANDPATVSPASDGSFKPNQSGKPILGSSAPALGGVASPVAPSLVSSPTPASGGDSNTTSIPTSFDDGTGPPTLAPVLEIFGTGLRLIQTDPVYLRITGDFDPETEEDVFFRNLELLLGPYSRANIGDRLQEIQLMVDFISDPVSATFGTATKLQVERTVWSEVVVVYFISGDSYFSRALGTEFLERFFVAGNKQNFIARLKNDDIQISSLERFSEFPASITDDFADSDGDPIGAIPEGDENEDGAVERPQKDYTSAIVAAVLSAGIVLCALGAIVAANRRRRREHIALSVFDAQNNPIDDMGYSDIDEDDVPTKGRNYGRSEAMSAHSTLSTKTTVKAKAVAQRSQSHSTLTPREELNLEAADVFTDPDGDHSFCAMHNEYHENADSNQEAPQSPVWSVDNYSTITPYSNEEEYVAARRRWHQLNDPDYIGIMDCHSVGGHEHSEYGTNSLYDGDGSIKAASIA